MSIVYQVWEAVEEDKRMPTGTKISLEVLSKEDDGIFPSERSWNSFLTSNFGDGGKYMAVAPEDLEFTFEYDANNYKRGANMPTMVEIFVTAHVKEPSEAPA